MHQNTGNDMYKVKILGHLSWTKPQSSQNDIYLTRNLTGNFWLWQETLQDTIRPSSFSVLGNIVLISCTKHYFYFYSYLIYIFSSRRFRNKTDKIPTWQNVSHNCQKNSTIRLQILWYTFGNRVPCYRCFSCI